MFSTKFKYVLAFLALACSCLTELNAQGVIVVLQRPPPYQFTVERFWKVTLTNPSSATYRVYLVGKATERADGRVVEATTASFDLPPGMKVVGSRDLAPLNVKEYNSKYSKVVKNIGTVPSGDYDICVTAYNANDNTVLGEMCVESEVRNLTQVELLQPNDAAVVQTILATPVSPDEGDLRAQFMQIVRDMPDPSAVDVPAALKNLVYLAHPELLNYPDIDKNPPIVGPPRGGPRPRPPPPPPIAPPPDVDNAVGQAISMLKDPGAYLNAIRQAENPMTLIDMLLATVKVRMKLRTPPPPDRAPSFGDTERGFSRDAHDDNFSASGKVRVRTNPPPPPDWTPSFGDTRNNDGLSLNAPGGIVTFSWLPPAPVPAGARVTYTLRITEMVGRQSPYDALHSNPAAIVLQNIVTNIAQVPLAARRLRSGSRYAWSVDVYLNGVLVQNSTVRSFSMDDPALYEIGCKNRPCPKLSQPPPESYDANRTGNRLFASLLMDPEFLLGNPSTLSSPVPRVTPFALAGSARVEAQYADRIGSYSELPKNRLTADLRPGFVLYGLPFGSNFQLSTLQDANRQSLNSFGINFDFEGMRQGLQARLQDAVTSEAETFSSLDAGQLTDIASPSRLTDNLQQYGGITGAENLFMSIRSLGIGTNYPSYSEYVLSGIPVTGVNLELNPGIFYTAFTAARNQRPVDNAAYLRNLYSGRLGVGQKENTHLYLTGLYVSDDVASIQLDPLNTTLTPRENYVVGMEGKLSLGEHLALEGEGALSLMTRDTRDAEFASSSIPSFVVSMTTPRLSSSVDFMYTGRLRYTNIESATKISAGVKMIGPGYASLGVPNLRTDQFGYEGKLDQQFFDRRVTLGSFFRMYNDNLIDWKSSTTTMMAYGVNLGFNFPQLPYLRISFSPISQKNNASDPLYKFRTDMLMTSVMTGYSYSLGSVFASTSLAYTGQKTETGNTAGDFTSNSLMLSEMLSFSFPLTVGLNLGLIESRTPLGYGMIRNADLNGSFPIGEIFTVGVGVNLVSERSQNERLGFYMDNAITITQGLDLNLRLEKANYNDFFLTGNTYREFLATAAIVTRW